MIPDSAVVHAPDRAFRSKDRCLMLPGLGWSRQTEAVTEAAAKGDLYRAVWYALLIGSDYEIEDFDMVGDCFWGHSRGMYNKCTQCCKTVIH